MRWRRRCLPGSREWQAHGRLPTQGGGPVRRGQGGRGLDDGKRVRRRSAAGRWANVWLLLSRKVRRRFRSHTSDDGADRYGERCAKGPFLLKAVASAGGGKKVDGIPTSKSRHQAGAKSRRVAVIAEHCETPRGVVGIAHTTADCDGEHKQLPCCE